MNEMCSVLIHLHSTVFLKTSNTLTWTLHLLAQNPECQDRLYKELRSVIPDDKIPSAAEVTRIPYLRAVIKESLRWDGWSCVALDEARPPQHVLIFSKAPEAGPAWLVCDGGADLNCSVEVLHRLLAERVLFYRMYPVVSMNGRVFLDRDVTIGGYKFPKNVGLRPPGEWVAPSRSSFWILSLFLCPDDLCAR